jgi:glycosyltransferase involved in cell wall biosynthesis
VTTPAPRPLLLGLDWSTTYGGGLNRYLRELGTALAADGGPAPRAVVVGPADGAPPWVRAVTSLDVAVPARLRAFGRVAAEEAAGADVVDVHFALNGTVALAARALRRLPLVVHFQGPWADESAEMGEHRTGRIAAKRAVERAVYRRAAALVVLSRAFGDILVERYGVPRERIRVLAPGVDLDRFRPGDRAAARAALGVPEHAWVAVVVRRLVPRMGIDVLLDAWARLDDPDGLLLVVGGGVARPDLERRAGELGLGGRVRFLGQVPDDDLVAAYRAADVSVVPSLALEGFGLVVLEALACGTPVVATDAGGLGEAVEGLDPGLVVPAGDAGALAARLAAARSGAEPLPSPAACRAFAEEHSWAAVAERHRRLYAEVAAADRPLRVVVLDHTAQPSGAELSLLRFLQDLPGVRAHVILGADGPLVERLRAAGVEVEVMAMDERARGLSKDAVRPGTVPLASAVATGAYVARLARRIRQLRPDLVHTNSLKADVYGGAAARLAGVPVVWHVHDRVSEDYLPAGAVRLLRGLARVVPAALVANSRATAATLPGGVPTVVVHEPLPPAGPAPARRHRDGGDPGDGGGPFRVGIVGRLSPWKGQDVFLRAFAAAFPPGTPGVEAAIVGGALFGEAGIEGTLRALCDELGIAGVVDFRGFREDVDAELARLDVLVHASVIPEPFGMVVVEGMAAGLPVVAVGEAGPTEVITDHVDGVLYPINDDAALAAALRELHGDPDLRERLGRAAMVRAEDFRPRVLAPGLLEAYRLATAPGRRRARRSSARSTPSGGGAPRG